MEILNQLNESQQQAVLYNEGAHLIVAGAGSGKTRVLTFKIAYLLEQAVLKPWEILALTFTNKAAREMKERIGRIVGGNNANYIHMGTFHSVFSRILRVEAERIGYKSNFTIYDQNDSVSLIKSIIKEKQLNDKTYKPSSVANVISNAKNRLMTAANFNDPTSQLLKSMPEFPNIFMAYNERCRQANAMDFDDLLVYTYRLFDEHEDIRQKYSNRFKYVLVDEYQDTNYVQQAILIQLTKDHQHICAVGDDAQSIYSFRGANIDNILNFSTCFHDTKVFKLEQNYRSTQLIVKAANSLIKKNQHQIPKNVFSEKDAGEPLTLKMAYSDKEEAIIVCNEIKRIHRQEADSWNDFAILYRTNSQSRSFEEYMRKEGIPYRIYGGMSFFQRKEIKDVIAYFRAVSNPDDEEALKRIINTPARGIGDTTIGKIVNAAQQNGVSLWKIISNPDYYSLDINKGTKNKIGSFCQLLDSWIERRNTDDAYSLGTDIIKESGLSKEIYSGKDPEDIARQQNLEELVSGIQDFVETKREEGNEEYIYIADYLQEVSLLTDLDSDDGEDGAKVVLMTIHSAKGLEFPYVFVVGLEENIFPSPMSCNSLRELEEERRLLYVAITRAEKRCMLTCAQNRFRFGRVEFDSPSRFIRDIDPSLLRVDTGHSTQTSSMFGNKNESHGRMGEVLGSYSATKNASFAPKTERPSVSPLNNLKSVRSLTRSNNIGSNASSSGNAALAVGNVIEHQRFGIGTVVKVEGVGENTKATVEFRNAGVKQLLLKFAKYTIVK